MIPNLTRRELILLLLKKHELTLGELSQLINIHEQHTRRITGAVNGLLKIMVNQKLIEISDKAGPQYGRIYKLPNTQ